MKTFFLGARHKSYFKLRVNVQCKKTGRKVEEHVLCRHVLQEEMANKLVHVTIKSCLDWRRKKRLTVEKI